MRLRPALPRSAPSGWRFALVALLIPACLGVLACWLTLEYAVSQQVRVAALRASDRTMAAMAMLSALKEAETAQRGFLLTGDATFLHRYVPAELGVRAMLARLESLSADRRATAELDRLTTAKFAEMAHLVTVRRTRGLAAAIADIQERKGERLMDRMRAVTARLVVRERRATATRLGAYAARARWIGVAIVALIVATTIVLGIGAWVIWRYRTARYRAAVQAFEVGERNRIILDSTIDAIVIINPSGSIETINAAATAMLGYAVTDLDRRDIEVLSDIAPGSGNFHARIGLADGRLRQAFLTDRTVRHRDGRAIPVDIAMGVMALPSGDHIVAAFRDISERKRVERMKDDLISTVSHEIRTPLTSIVGALGLLRAGAAGRLPRNADRLVVIAENNSRRLIRLINDMLDIDRIEGGRLTIAREPLDLRGVMNQACEGSAGLAAANAITIHCDVPGSPAIVAGDGDRLVQVVTNLLSNAIRLSPEGSEVTIALSVLSTGRAMVSVDDRGPGVPAAFRDRIFGRFERAEQQAGTSGTGLGLAIAREIVARHDGEIWFEDRAGGGTRFAFAIDLLRARAAPAGADTTRILIAEQDSETAAMLARLVAAEGCAGDTVATSAEARAALGRYRYDAIVVDLNLPDEGGLSLARSLRSEAAALRLPVIVVAPDVTDGDDPAPLDMIDWIRRPIDPARVSVALRAALDRTDVARPVVLHLEDDKDMREIVASSLGTGALVLHAYDLASARAILETQSPDVAIIDVQLPDGNGLDLIPMLVDAAGIAVPTIIFSAQDVPAHVARRVGAVLVKSRGSLPDLKATLHRLLRTAAARPDPADPEETS